MEKKFSVIEVFVFDNGNAGGPMWSASSDLIETILCRDMETAFDVALRYIKRAVPSYYKEIVDGRHGERPFHRLTIREKKSRLGDIGPLGFSFERKNVR